MTWGDLKTYAEDMSLGQDFSFETTLRIIHNKINRTNIIALPEIFVTREWVPAPDGESNITNPLPDNYNGVVDSELLYDGNYRVLIPDDLSEVKALTVRDYALGRIALTFKSMENAEKTFRDVGTGVLTRNYTVEGNKIILFPNGDHAGISPFDIRLQYKKDLESPFNEDGTLNESGGADNIILQEHTNIYVYSIAREVAILTADDERIRMMEDLLEEERNKALRRYKFKTRSGDNSMLEQDTLNNQGYYDRIGRD